MSVVLELRPFLDRALAEGKSVFMMADEAAYWRLANAVCRNQREETWSPCGGLLVPASDGRKMIVRLVEQPPGLKI